VEQGCVFEDDFKGVVEHLGGHWMFVAEFTSRLVWDRKSVIAITIENSLQFADSKTGQTAMQFIFVQCQSR
jgi:hypothetical protein